MTTHCRECGSRLCNHHNCPECSPCTHCNGGDRTDKFFGHENDPPYRDSSPASDYVYDHILDSDR